MIALAAPAAQAGPGRLGSTSRASTARSIGPPSGPTASASPSSPPAAAAGTTAPWRPTSCGTDPNYDANYANARAAGVRVGPYHRAFVNGANEAELLADARAEADVFIASVGAIGRKDLAPALDVETPFEVPGPNGLKKWLRVWVSGSTSSSAPSR